MLVQINKLITYLSIYAHEYSIEELNKIIVESLLLKAMVNYIGEGSNNLEDKQNILELITQIDNKFKLKAEAAGFKKKANP